MTVSKLVFIIFLLTLIGGWWYVSTTEVAAPVIDEARSAADNVVPAVAGSVEVYDGISVAKGTTELDLSARGLDGSLKAEVRQLTQLEVLNISNNNFTGLPAEVGQLTKLRVLNLSNNPFTGLPYELGNLANLEVLDLRGTNYAEADLAVITQSLPKSTRVLTD